MDDPNLTVRPPRSMIRSLVVDHNPFYVVSAMCMLFGIFAVNNSLTWSPIPLHNLLTMIVTLNVYELALIGLAVLLLRHRVARDPVLLLIIETFFLVDVGFLNMEVFARDVAIGLLVNAVVLAAAIAKVLVVFTAAKIPLSDGRIAYVVAQLAVLFMLPGLFAIIAHPRDTYLPPLAMYAGWWIAGLLPILYTMLVGSFSIFRKREDGGAPGHDLIMSRLLLIVPMLSIVAHLSLSHWVYKSEFHTTDLAPLLLGLAVAIGRGDHHVGTLAFRMRMQLGLPIVTMLLSAYHIPPDMLYDGWHQIPISPLRIAMFGSMLVYLDGLFLHRHVLYAIAASVCVWGIYLGESVRAINKNSTDMARQSVDALDRLVPKTLAGWGVVSIIAAFVLLGFGAMVSFKRRAAEVGEKLNL